MSFSIHMHCTDPIHLSIMYLAVTCCFAGSSPFLAGDHDQLCFYSCRNLGKIEEQAYARTPQAAYWWTLPAPWQFMKMQRCNAIPKARKACYSLGILREKSSHSKELRNTHIRLVERYGLVRFHPWVPHLETIPSEGTVIP
jgi:hypothetical protein